jgi:hypothetical protein
LGRRPKLAGVAAAVTLFAGLVTVINFCPICPIFYAVIVKTAFEMGPSW